MRVKTTALRGRAAAVLLLALLLGSAVTSVLAQEEELLARGRFLYRVYCASCHGESGKGDGASADTLKVKPANLTRLTRGNEGEFPFERVYRTIDGREVIRGHGTGPMPIWGLTFQELDRDVDQEDQVRGKILQLIKYLESFQQE
jgi:mono/diheme cytochrome c family protein